MSSDFEKGVRKTLDLSVKAKDFTNDTLKDYLSNMNPYGYKPFTIEEFIVECEENYFLFTSMPEYFVWAKKKVNSKRKK